MTASAGIGSLDLLQRGVHYTIGAVNQVTTDLFDAVTPCRDWNLRELLTHLNDSMDVLCEAMDCGAIGPGEASPPLTREPDPIVVFHVRARRILRAWGSFAGTDHSIAIIDRSLMVSMVAAVGATEIAVHGWDVYRACGQDRPIPYDLALELLERCAVPDEYVCRRPLFDHAVPISAVAGPSDRLVAMLGRDPGTQDT
jgi:uncharacterized protein (TIGR03086 family)